MEIKSPLMGSIDGSSNSKRVILNVECSERTMAHLQRLSHRRNIQIGELIDELVSKHVVTGQVCYDLKQYQKLPTTAVLQPGSEQPVQMLPINDSKTFISLYEQIPSPSSLFRVCAGNVSKFCYPSSS